MILIIVSLIAASAFIFDGAGNTSNILKYETSSSIFDEITTFYTSNDVKYKLEIDIETISESLQLAKDWLFSNFNTGGYFTYEYNPSNNQYSNNKNNIIRQLMSSRILAEEVEKHEDLINWRNASRIHRMNLNSVFNNWYREDGDLGYIYFGDKAKLGAMAMAIRVLIDSPYYEKYEEITTKLANTILYLQNDNGSFRAWYIEPDYSYDEEYLLRFYSGEAILSLIELYEVTGKIDYLNAAIKSQDFYLEEYIDQLEDDKDYYPAFIPWHSMCLNKLYYITSDTKYREAIFKITDKVIMMQNQSGEPDIDFLGRFYNPATPEYGYLHSASPAVYLERVCYTYEIT